MSVLHHKGAEAALKEGVASAAQIHTVKAEEIWEMLLGATRSNLDCVIRGDAEVVVVVDNVHQSVHSDLLNWIEAVKKSKVLNGKSAQW
jgi:hypothetical protein